MGALVTIFYNIIGVGILALLIILPLWMLFMLGTMPGTKPRIFLDKKAPKIMTFLGSTTAG